MSLARLMFRLILGKRLPIVEGEQALPGIHGRIAIHRDRWGIPLILAEDGRDGPFALGYCHAQDRAFQLEVLRRVTRGRVAEMAGPGALPVDRLSRRIGFHRSAKKQWPLLDADIRERLKAYSQGVEAGLRQGCSRVAHEFSLLGITPSGWEPVDTLAVTKLLSFTLAANWDAELARLKVLVADGPEALAKLDATFPDWQAAISPVGATVGKAVDRLAEDLATFLDWSRKMSGSNNWALSPSRTRTGRPILANDPHMDAGLPAHWYLASLSSPAEHVAGATFVGGPLFLVGHNEKAAWGLTAGLVDNTDLFMEYIGPDGRSVRQGDSYQPCHVMEEVIEVKGSAPVTESVLITPRGPIISPGLHETSQALSLRATWLDPLPVTGLFRIHQVGSFEEFRAAFGHWPVAAQNMVYADTSGTIGWQLIGRAPVRKKGHGTLPQHGADPGAGWRDDPVPFEEMPSLENPPSGFVATANNRPQPEGVGPFLGVDFIDGYRYQAIHDALGQRRDWTVEDTLALQMNQQALAWVEMRDFVLSARGSDPDTRLALRLLGEWDGHLGGDSIPAAVYELFLSEMFTRITRAKAPNSWRWLLGANLSPITRFNFTLFRRTGHLIRLLRQRPAGWFSHPWEQEIAQALGEAVRRLRAHRGADQHRWKWGEVRPLVMHHLLSRAPGKMGRAFAAIFNLGPFPCGGDADVINQAGIEPLTPFAKADNIASMRAVFDVGAWENCRFTLPGGQSGNPLSPHYGDLFPLWQKGQGVPIAFTAEEVEQARQKTLILRPSS